MQYHLLNNKPPAITPLIALAGITQFSLLVFAMSLVPLVVSAGTIQGTIKGSTVTAPAITADPNVRDDTDTATTIDVSFFGWCPYIVDGAAAFPGYNFVFAGNPGVGSNFTSIAPGDFTISQYAPWVVNSNDTTNNITDPDGSNSNRGVTGQDAGGANIVISYTPRNAGDPTKVNFVQAYIESTNNGAFGTGTMDNGGAASPYYNARGDAGTGKVNRTGTIPLVTDATTAAWLVDIPYGCENGPIPPGGTAGCLGGVDDTMLSQTVTFQTFIESDQTFDGKTYQVLYGGVQWGYTFTAVDTPEPSTVLLLACVFAAAGLSRRFRRPRGAV